MQRETNEVRRRIQVFISEPPRLVEADRDWIQPLTAWPPFDSDSTLAIQIGWRRIDRPRRSGVFRGARLERLTRRLRCANGADRPLSIISVVG